MERSRHYPSSLVIASLALVIAFAGTGVAGYAAGKQSGDTLIKKSSLSGNRLKPDSVTGKQVAESSLGTVPVAQLARSVAAPSLTLFAFDPAWSQNPQETLRGAGWRKDASGFVHLQGNLVGDGAATSIATLPVGARPASPIAFPAPGEGGIVVVIVGSNGQITTPSSLTYVSLDVVSFYPGG